MDTQSLVQITIAFLSGGAFLGLLGFIKWLIQRRDRIQLRSERLRAKSDRIPNVLTRIHDVYDIMHKLLNETAANRVSLMKIENGGDIPALGKELHSTIVYEVRDGQLPARRETWVKQRCDEQYMKALLTVSREGSTLLKAHNLKEGLLHDMFISDGVKCAALYRVHYRTGHFFYVRLDFTESFKEDATTRDLLRVTRTQIETLFRDDLEDRDKNS